MDLKEWIITYLKNRDIIDQSIERFEDLNGDFIVHKKTGSQLFLLRPEFSDSKEIQEKSNRKLGLILLNTKKNLTAVIKSWSALSEIQDLCLYFVNPNTNEKWLLYPHTHAQITEKSALKRGLESLFSMVSEVT